MKKLLVALGILVVLLIVIVVAAPFLIPVDTLKAQAIERVKQATGRDLRIEGPVRLSLVPHLAVDLNQVSFANAPGAETPDMAKLKRLQVELKLLPLLSGNVVVDRFVLTEPVIALEVDKQGRPNWVFGAPQTTPPASAGSSPAKPAPASQAAGGGSALQDIQLGDIKLVDGKVTYHDRRTEQRYELDSIDLAIKLPSLDKPLAADGDLTWRKQKLTIALNVEKPRALLEAKPTPMALRLASSPVAFDYKGLVTNGTPLKVAGDIDLKVPSVRELAAWTGNPLTLPGSGLGPLAIAGKIDVGGPKVAFTGAKLALDDIKGTGEFTVDSSGARPALRGKLALDKLDLNPYLPPEQPATAPAAGTQPAAPSGAPPQTATPHAAPAPQAGWSDAPIDVAPLKLVDADFALSVGQLRYRKIEIGKTAIDLALKNGRLTTDLKEMELYKGTGKAHLVVDGSAGAPAIEAVLNFAKIEAEPLLRDAIDLDRLTGTGALDIAVNGKGRSQREIVSSLAGKGQVAFTDGAIKGINLAAMMRNIGSAFQDSGGTQKTDFSELGGTFTVAQGVATNKDLALKSPLLRIEGAGTVNLPNRTLDYRLTPKLVASTEGQGGKADLAGITVPVIVEGPWDHLSYRPDLAAVIEQRVDPGKLLEGLTQRGGAAPAQPDQPAQPAPGTGKPADILRNLLKR